MQKITALILAVVLTLSMATTTFAAEIPQGYSTQVVTDTGYEASEDEHLPPDIEMDSNEVPPLDAETPSDTETLPEDKLPSEEQAPEEQVICTCEPAIADEDGIHTAPDCPLYAEAEPKVPMPLMEESGNNLWSDTGNYNADWTGLTDYVNTTEFIITDAAELAAFIFCLNQNKSNTFAGKTVTLESDIDLSDHLWDMRGGIPRTGGNGNFFAGTFDGGGHTISGMIIDYDNEYVGMGNDFGNFGLFADLNGATIRNLTISDARLTIGYVAPSFPAGIGVLCGSISGSTIENVTVTNASIAQKENAQGSIGFYFGSIAGIEFSPYTRTPSNEPNQYIGCTIDGLSITYSEAVDDNWTALMGFGGMIGGVFPLDAEPSYQSSISDCKISDVTIRRSLAAESFAFECYGGVIGFAPYPVTIENTHITDLSIEFGAPSGNTDSNMMGTPFATGMVGGFIGYAERDADSFPNGTSSITNSSVSGSFAADNQADLLPIYVGGLIGVNNGVTTTNCYTRLDLTGVKDKETVRYGNLFGLLQTSTEQGATVNNNIFDNHDYLATAAEIDAPSVGYLGKKLSTLALAGELDNTADIHLSQNWSILKNILTVGEKDYPLDYVQCAEKTTDVDFYDHWTVDVYEHEHLTQDSDTAQVTFDKDSGEDTFPVSAEITAKNGNPTWHFTKDIIVLPSAVPPTPEPIYTVTYLPGAQGAFAPQEYTDLYTGDVTPAFNGIPTGNPNWSFNGWEPEVAATVTESAVYIAQWKYVNIEPDPTGSLTITKTVTGNAGDKHKDFTFEVTFADGGTYSYVGSKSGTITSGDTLTLQHGQSIIIQNIPVGVGYSVSELEADRNGYTTHATGETGTIATDGKTAHFTNRKTASVSPDPTGDLTIVKTVTGNAGDKHRDFTFEVTFTDGGTYSYIGSKSGAIASGNTLTLRHGQSVTIQNIPVGVGYSVRELEADRNGYTTHATGETGTIATDGKTAHFTNRKTASVSPDPTGDLTIAKTVTGNAGDKHRYFTFALTFTDGGTYSYIGSKSGAIASGDTLTLRNGQSVTIQNIPVGVGYSVRELEADRNGYTTHATGETGTISIDGKMAHFTNRKTSSVSPDPTGDLTIAKTVTGNAGDKHRDFTFALTFTDGGTYSYIGSKSGTIASGDTLTLRHGQSVTILDIPAEEAYTVIELEADQGGYQTTVTGGRGRILADEAVTAAFVNDRQAQPQDPTDHDIPQTGDRFALSVWVGLLVLSGIGCVGVFIFKRRKTNQRKS